MNDSAGGVLLIVLFVAFAAAMTAWHYSRSRSVLEQWADANGYRLLHTEHRHLLRGPFAWTTSKGRRCTA